MQNALVSILIPTHNRPDYLVLALQSALAQTYPHFEIVISDNSEADDSLGVVREVAGPDPRVRHLRCPEKNHYLENWLNALAHARGQYIAFLMDDDLFHPEKLARMVPLLQRPEIGLVTSYRQLIDEAGRPLADHPSTAPMFASDALVPGDQLGDNLLLNGRNMVGEPTTAMMRRSDLGAGFGFYAGHQYQVLSDVATWLRLMKGRQVAVLREPLSQFRLHGGQDQRRPLQALQANLEWLQLLIDSHDQGLYVTNKAQFQQHLANKLSALVPFMAGQAEAVRNGPFHIEAMQQLMRTAFDRLFH